MTAKEIKELTNQELEAKLIESRKELLNARLRKNVQVRPHLFSYYRKLIARIMTEFRSRQLANNK